jgi:DNA-binding transcriptional LysR family regulator
MSDAPPALPLPGTFPTLKISSRQIALLNALGELGNLRKAASAIHTTQPAASLLLQQLEERLGVQLFERLPRGMQPTAFGEVMIRYARGALHEFEYAEAQLAELARGATGMVRIGTVMGPVPTLLTRGVLAFKAAHPKVRIALDVGTSDELLPASACRVEPRDAEAGQ